MKMSSLFSVFFILGNSATHPADRISHQSMLRTLQTMPRTPQSTPCTPQSTSRTLQSTPRTPHIRKTRVGQERHTSQRSKIPFAFRRPNVGMEHSLTFLNLTDIPYNGDSHKILGLVYVKYLLLWGRKLNIGRSISLLCKFM